ncbi:MAG TPA: YncE family protein [Candidatus Dormibacteraeota bacterium]|nr:YncE family protein [Candidatus Dormibacteraeota bacterium]
MRKFAVILPSLLFFFAGVATTAAQPPLKLVAKYKMPAAVSGHFDHLAVDVAGNRLFAACETAGEVLVFNLRTGELEHTITGIGIPHAIHVSDRLNRIFVTDGGVGGVQVFNGKTYDLVKFIPLRLDTDSIAYDPKTGYLYVVSGGDHLAEQFSYISVIDTKTETKVADIRLDGNTLEAMALAKSSPMLYNNDPALNQINVINRDTHKLVATWPVTMCDHNVAIALDEAAHRLFTACHSGEVVAFDTQTGQQVAAVPIAHGVDDMIFDPATNRLYVTCGADGGWIYVYHIVGPDSYVLLGRVAGAPFSKNEVLAPSLNRLYTTVPPNAGVPGEIYVYQVQ